MAKFTSVLDPKNYAAWEQDPSTRESIRLHTKPYPVDSTLAVAGTPQNLITVSPGLATVNLVTNPSMDTTDPPAGYGALRSAVLARSALVYKYGSYSMSVTPPGTVIGEGAYWNLDSWPMDQPLAVSAYFSDNAGGGDDARVEVIAHTTPLTGVTDVRFAIGSTVTFAGTGWYRSSLVVEPKHELVVLYFSNLAVASFTEDEIITGSSGVTAIVRTVGTNWLAIDTISGAFTSERAVAPNTTVETLLGSSSGATANVSRIVRTHVNMETLYLAFVTPSIHNTPFYVDGVQAEANFSVTAYCDGDQGYYHWWDGTAHASTSRRWRKLSSIRSYRLHCTRDVYVAYDQDADNTGTNAEDRGEFIPAGTDFGEDHPIYLDSHISFVNVNAGELPRIYGLVWGV